jgi:hypothetical protein
MGILESRNAPADLEFEETYILSSPFVLQMAKMKLTRLTRLMRLIRMMKQLKRM